MDIDAPPPAGTALSDFGLRYPLPLRIVVLSAVTALGFATNLHLLSHLGIDTAHVLDVRLEPANNPSLRASLPPGAPPPYVHPTKLYPPLYSLAAAALAWATLGWVIHGALTGADPRLVVEYRLVPCIVALAVVVALCWPGNALSRPYRLRFLRALRRIVHPSLNAAVPFCDIILADILTSSAKVLGDVWLAGCLVLTGEGVAGVAGDACKRVWGVPFMTSLPYLFRFRQCLSEVYTRSTPTPRRSLLNALKYATAFPVIILSAMQTVIGDPFDTDDDQADGVHEAGERWIGRTTLFNLWLLAVLVNSLYSFWWDVTNDWGLSLLSRSGWHSSPAVSYAFINPPPLSAYSRRHGGISSHLATGAAHSPSTSQSGGHGRARSLAAGALLDPTAAAPGSHEHAHALNGAPQQHVLASTTFPPPPSRPHTPTPPSPKPASHSPSHLLHPHRPGHTRAFSTAATPNLSYPFLRPILLLPDPLVYYTAICIDLLLRLTWSLKLSSHLHSAQEVESGVFAVEALEVVRRWMWVFLRIEWEAVRKGAGNDAAPSSSSASPLGAAGPSSSAAGVLWLDKGDGEARLRAHDEYELALRDAKGGGERGGQGKGKGRALDPALEEEGLGLLSSGSGGGRVREGELI
ncbi:hypothetical protein JCM8208_002681 [Rhodotorula glutinis]